MQLKLKTLLNFKENYPGFVYPDVQLKNVKDSQRIEVTVKPRQGSKGICSGCGKRQPGYDRLTQREFIHVPLWGIIVVLLYCMRRLSCPTCGIVVEIVPWSFGKSPLTIGYSWFLSEWAKLLSMQEVARQFKTTWHHVFSGVSMAVIWGRERIDLSGITAIGIDEIYWAKSSFMTLAYQIDNHCKRLLWCGEKGTEKTINEFFHWFGEERSLLLKFVCSDTWKPYLKAIAQYAKNALNILDRFHISQKLSEAINKVRATETTSLLTQGKNIILKHSRWALLKNQEKLTEKQKIKLKDLLACNLKTIRSHKQLILNWFEAKNAISLGAVEGQNNKVKVVIRKSYGFKTGEILKISLYHKMASFQFQN